MPQKEIRLTSWILDPVTGFLTSLDKRHKFTAGRKSEFLEQLLAKRDVEDACKAVGINRRILTAHLRADERFKAEYASTIALIKNPERLRQLETVDRLWKKTQN